MEKSLKFTLVMVLALGLSLNAVGALAISENDNNDDYNQKKQEQVTKKTEKPGLGPVKGLEQAVEKLEKFELKQSEDFEKPVRPSLGVNANGQVRITGGKVVSLGTNSFVVRIWGLQFTVNVTAETKIFARKDHQLTFADIKVGDTVNVGGTTSEAAPGVMTADVIHDQTAIVAARDEEVARMRMLIEDLIRRLTDLLQRAGRPLPPGFSPLPSVSPSPSPLPSPSPSPSPSPVPSPSPTPTA